MCYTTDSHNTNIKPLSYTRDGYYSGSNTRFTFPISRGLRNGICCGDIEMRVLQASSHKGGAFFMKNCCFIGHRSCEITEDLRERVSFKIRLLILMGVKVFYFGNRTIYTDMCYELVSELKSEFPKIKRVYVSSKNTKQDKENQSQLMNYYEGIWFSKEIQVDDTGAYLAINIRLIKKSKYCLFYFDKYCLLPERGLSEEEKKKRFYCLTRVMYNYAGFKKKHRLNTYESII